MRVLAPLLLLATLVSVGAVQPSAGTLPAHRRPHLRGKRTSALAQAGRRIQPAEGSLTTATAAQHKALYRVEIGTDVEEIDPAVGARIFFAKGGQSMRLDRDFNESDTGRRALAWGRFEDRITETGWSELHVEVSPDEAHPNDAKIYAAGFIEGLLTSVRISEFYSNTMQVLLKEKKSQNALGYIKSIFQHELTYLRSKTSLERGVMTVLPADAYWKHARYVLVQLWGVCDGYNFAAKQLGGRSLGLDDFLFLNAGAELQQLLEALNAAPAGSGLADRRFAERGRGSAMVRLADGDEDLLVGHTTWDDYSMMLRVFKSYKFPLSDSETVAEIISFPSYPGAVSSTDDFYIMSSGLSSMSTALEVINTSALAKMLDVVGHPRIPAFVHAMAVNRLSHSATHWAHLFRSEGPVAYAAQWMAVDYNNFEVNKTLPDGSLWMVEVLPGLSHEADISSELRTKGYWPSYNRPYFADVRSASGYALAEEEYGEYYSWSANPRAQIFEASARNANNLRDMRNLMSRNLFPNAGVVPGGPGHDISARSDLEENAARPRGGIDAKVSNLRLVRSMSLQAVSGPSHGANLPAFTWRRAGKDTWPSWPHLGQPDAFDFPFVQLSSVGDASELSDA